MFGTSIPLAEKYDYLEEKFKKGYAFLRRTDLAELEEGTVPLGDGVTAYVQRYVTVPSESARFEAHDRYFDIQFIVSGEEIFEIADRASLEPSVPYDAEKDIVFYKDPARGSAIYLKTGDFLVVTPEEAHKPRCSVTVPRAVEKIVVKVPV